MTFKEAVMAFNDNAWKEGLGFRLQYGEDRVMGDLLVRAVVVVANANGIEYPDGIYITKKASMDMTAFFLVNGITLCHNNTGQIFWEAKK